MIVLSEKHIPHREAFCTHCGSTLGYYPADIKIEPLRDTIIYIKCSVCGQSIILHKLSTNEEYFNWIDNDFKRWRDGI